MLDVDQLCVYCNGLTCFSSEILPVVNSFTPHRNKMVFWLHKRGRGEVGETFWASELLISLLRWHNRPLYAGVYKVKVYGVS